MKDNSLSRLGGACSMLLGLCYAAAGITTVLPSALTYGNDLQQPFMHFEENRGLLLANYWALGLSGAFRFAVLPAMSETVQHLNAGWVRWTSHLAMLGFALTILDN